MMERNTKTCACGGLGSKNPKQGQEMTGAQALVASLEAEGVDLIFGYPGGQVMHIYDALYDSDQIRHVMARHEQAAVHEADGYTRSTGKVGTVLVTSGPGATNTVTGIATAYMDSIPMVVITGQVPRGAIGTDSFQESDILCITMPIVKHSFLLKSVDDIAHTVREAYHIASTGRRGPVLIDVPSDLMKQMVKFEYPEEVHLPSYKPNYKGNAKQIRAAAAEILQAKQPVILAGGGVVASGSSEQLIQLAESMQIPMVTTLMGKGGIPAAHELNLGAVGIHGSKYANLALNESDLIIACGTRFADRVTGSLDKFAPNARVIHIDIDPAEIGKVREVQVPIVGDLQMVLTALNKTLEEKSANPQTGEWLEQLHVWQDRYPLYDDSLGDRPDEIVPELVMRQLSAKLDLDKTIVTTDVGQHQMWANQFIDRAVPRSWFTSGGLGTMGFGLPAAIGAAIGCPDKQVVCVSGDGSFQMNMQEMATAIANDAPVKVMVLNNGQLGMVRQLQRFNKDGRFASTKLDGTPDFAVLAQAYGWGGASVSAPEDMDAALDEMLAYPGPYLLSVNIGADQNVYPIVTEGMGLEEGMGALDAEAGSLRTGIPENVKYAGQRGDI